MSIYLSIYRSIYRVLTQWHSSKAGEDFLSWDPQMFSDFREEYGNCDVLICKSNIVNILETMQPTCDFGRLLVICNCDLFFLTMIKSLSLFAVT